MKGRGFIRGLMIMLAITITIMTIAVMITIMMTITITITIMITITIVIMITIMITITTTITIMRDNDNDNNNSTKSSHIRNQKVLPVIYKDKLLPVHTTLYRKSSTYILVCQQWCYQTPTVHKFSSLSWSLG